MKKNFLSAWLIYWTSVFLIPVTSIYPARIEAFYLQLVFVVLVLTAYYFVTFILNFRRVPRSESANIPRSLALIKLALTMSLLGFIFLVYDKIYIQGIDYSNGVALAREQWRQLGEDRGDQASSVFSLMGYLFGSAYYVAAVLAITQINVLSATQRFVILAACFLMVMANSAITGGRSSILLFGAFIIGAIASGGGLRFRDISGGRIQRWIAILGISSAAWYTASIFSQRADASMLDGTEYLLEFLPFLGLAPAEWFADLLNAGVLSSASAILVLAASYMTHSFASTAAILDGPTEDKTIIFTHFMSILSKLGLANQPDGVWFLSGRFPSFPGALWHQFGWVGFLMGSLLLGATSAVAKAWAALRPARLLPLGVFVLVDVVLILTPLMFAGDLLSFPFIVVAFILLTLVEKCLNPRSL